MAKRTFRLDSSQNGEAALGTQNRSFLAILALAGWIILCSPAMADDFFIVSGDAITSSSHPEQHVQVGERLPIIGLKKRFAGLQVQSTSGEDCNFCAMVGTSDRGFEVNYDADGIAVISLLCGEGCADQLGNEYGGRLSDAIGHAAICDGGEYTTCLSPRIEGLYYVLDEGTENCNFEIAEGPTKIPNCAKIGGFMVRKNF